ncbi:MAG TPA: hypothetical protein VJ551_02935, partial [Nitrososphaeraceae archaeon]|nr:hypothetical protein [Nitrososphaeraceae archaeon]
MAKLEPVVSAVSSRKAAVLVGIVIIFLVIIDLLVTRQVLPSYRNIEIVIFILTVTIGYGIGSWILLGYIGRVSKEIRSKSRFINLMHWTVMVVQFSLFGILLFVLFSNSPTNTRFLSHTVFAVSSALATVTMGAISFKFFSWYKLGEYKNFTILFYGIAALTLGMSIAEDVGTKLLMVHQVEEKTPPAAIIQSSFQYKASDKYDAEVIRKEVNPDITALLILPNSNLEYYNLLNSTVLPIAFIFRWIASTTLLRDVYQRIGKLPLSFWIILSLPLILYLVGKMPGFFAGESLAGVDEAYRYYFRILFRAGTIGGNIVFGLAFFVIARRLASSKIKDYLIITAIGDTIVGIALSTSALEPTYGVAAHSLVMLSSYMFSIGLYICAISLSQDSSLRKSIRRSNIGLIDNIGTAQMEQELREK